MRRLVAFVALAVVLLGVSGAGRTPRPAGTATVHAGHTQQIVLVGDSITAGGLVVAADRLDAQLRYRLQPGTPVVNQGVGGQCLVGCVPGGDLVDTAPGIIAGMSTGDVLVIDIGMNNLFTYPGDAAWTSAYTSITDAATARGVHFLVGDITPLGSNQAGREPLRHTLNTWLHDHYGAAATVHYSDVLSCTEAPCAGQPYADPRVGWPDGVHISDGGYDLMANMLVSQLHALGWVT
jgi:lysophospholipase L1-like esterase